MPSLFAPDPSWGITAFRAFLLLHLLVFAMWPWITRLFASRRDRGAGLAIPGSVFVYLLSAQILWRLGILELSFVWLLLLAVCLGLSGRYHFSRSPAYSAGTQARMRSRFLQSWILFSLLFWFWALIRSGDPGVSHTEQAMDVMWMGSGIASTAPHIQDGWLGGMPASYYADGHQALALLGRSLGLPLQISVNITQIIWFALSGLLAFEAAKTLYELRYKQGGTGAGLISWLLILFVSTPRGLRDAIQETSAWWWWDASRPITDNGSLLITEFPFFSFWLGDNHAHLIGLPILLFAVLSGIELLRCRHIRLWQTLLPALWVAWSWRINPWQTPTVLAIPLLALLLRKKKWRRAEGTAIGLAALLALCFCFPPRAPGPPFSLVAHNGPHTNLWEMMQVFGFLLPGLVWFWIKPPHRLWLGLYVLAVAMFFCVEWVYLDDAFHNRMNTLFKVYYQIWVLGGLLAAVGWMQALRQKKGIRICAQLSLVGCLLPGLVYAGRISWQATQSPSRSLNAWSVMPPDDQFLLQVASRLIKAGDRIAEAPGESYEASTSLLGTWTAGATLIGWQGHQLQWRPDHIPPPLWILYEAESPEDLAMAVETFNLDWVLLGPHEKEAFRVHPDWQSWMDTIAYRVVNQPERVLYEIK